MVGANGHDNGRGKVYVYYGSASGLSTTPDWTAVGEAGFNTFGNSVASAGDANGDGYGDIVVGARLDNDYTGKAYVYLGGATGLSAAPVWTAVGEASDSIFGASVAPALKIYALLYTSIECFWLRDALYACHSAQRRYGDDWCRSLVHQGEEHESSRTKSRSHGRYDPAQSLRPRHQR